MSTDFYKRNQVDATLFALIGGSFSAAHKRKVAEVPKEFRARISRLLEIDRQRGANSKGRRPKIEMAFHDHLPEGTGKDVQHSAFHAFALAIALDLLRFGLKQSNVANKISALRGELERVFTRSTQSMQTAGSVTSIDDKRWSLPVTRSASGHDKLDVSSFLVFRQIEVSPSLAKASGGELRAGAIETDHRFVESWDQLSDFLKEQLPDKAHCVLIIELAQLATRVVEVLPIQEPRKRGRA